MPTPTQASGSAEELVESLRALVRAEVTTAVRDSVEDSVASAVAEVRATLEERLQSLPAGEGGAGAPDAAALSALAPQICQTAEFQAEVRRQLEEAFQGVLPGLVKRLRGEIEKRLQTGEAAGGMSVQSVIQSSELKEVLEERFRTMLAYLKQEVIPMAIRQG